MLVMRRSRDLPHHKQTGLTNLPLSAIRRVATWASILFVSGALAYGFNTAITGCCPGDSGLAGRAGGAVDQPLAPALVEEVEPLSTVNGASAFERGLRIAEAPDRIRDNHSEPIGDW
jgi:hypothetical protein